MRNRDLGLQTDAWHDEPPSMRHPSLTSMLLALPAACGAEDPGAPPYRHLLLISLDTTRADHIGCYGGRVATPVLDELAATGVQFAHANTAATTTLAAHTSLMTGTWPHTHGVIRNGFVVDEANVMLAEVLRDAGFHTAAAIGSFAIAERFAIGQGFAHFDEDFADPSAPDVYRDERSAEEVTAALLAHLDGVGDSAERLFLFAHYFDPHNPYAPPAPFDSDYSADGAPVTSDNDDLEAAASAHQRVVTGQAFGHAPLMAFGFSGLAQALVGSVGQPTELDQRLADAYAGEVAYMDAAIGKLLDGLRERGLYDETLIVVVGDHGETFWEHHDFWNHGLWVYETTVHVPLLIHCPDGRYAGVQVNEPVSSIDVFPTLCELLSVPVPQRCEGVSLVSAMEGLEFERGPVFVGATQPFRAEREDGWTNREKPVCVRDGPWKYVRSRYNKVEQLFHLGRDPREQNDLLRNDLRPRAAQRLAALRAALDAWEASATPLPTQFDFENAEETRRRLQGLGYSGEDR